jgi:hypothetical protein
MARGAQRRFCFYVALRNTGARTGVHHLLRHALLLESYPPRIPAARFVPGTHPCHADRGGIASRRPPQPLRSLGLEDMHHVLPGDCSLPARSPPRPVLFPPRRTPGPDPTPRPDAVRGRPRPPRHLPGSGSPNTTTEETIGLGTTAVPTSIETRFYIFKFTFSPSFLNSYLSLFISFSPYLMLSSFFPPIFF